jgi:hypothetical protein
MFDAFADLLVYPTAYISGITGLPASFDFISCLTEPT